MLRRPRALRGRAASVALGVLVGWATRLPFQAHGREEQAVVFAKLGDHLLPAAVPRGGRSGEPTLMVGQARPDTFLIPQGAAVTTRTGALAADERRRPVMHSSAQLERFVRILGYAMNVDDKAELIAEAVAEAVELEKLQLLLQQKEAEKQQLLQQKESELQQKELELQQKELEKENAELQLTLKLEKEKAELQVKLKEVQRAGLEKELLGLQGLLTARGVIERVAQKAWEELKSQQLGKGTFNCQQTFNLLRKAEINKNTVGPWSDILKDAALGCDPPQFEFNRTLSTCYMELSNEIHGQPWSGPGVRLSPRLTTHSRCIVEKLCQAMLIPTTDQVVV